MKLYRVEFEMKVVLYGVAEDASKARDRAGTWLEEARGNGDSSAEPDDVLVEEATLKNIPYDWGDAFPYGVPNDHESKDRTVVQWIAAATEVES